MVKVFLNGKEINVGDLKIEWKDHFGRICNGDLTDYRNSEVDDAICEFDGGYDW